MDICLVHEYFLSILQGPLVTVLWLWHILVTKTEKYSSNIGA